ncbi:uncharacterized protein LOC108862772 isoform X2 [Raphanus sativus]|uniref:Uncharacterized protein LOC108862772 isoform X2 n=1 Tax=Raphanus sativus TaxID=3726 RepID=A0A9W3BRZ7_RAPSA|nr:uncharacterized protein LOC108862772 isoform X2 [Raphanus sativus]
MDTLPDPQSKSSSNVSPHRRETSRDSLVYLTTCMIGHLVEVHLKNGSVYRGIFHAADMEKDFGIVLKMASLIKDSRQRSRSDFFRKPPFMTFIVPADELVQVVAENLSVSSDGTLNTVQTEKPVDLFTDSSISKSRRVDQDREAGRAVDVFDDSGFNEEDDKFLDTCNDQTFGGSSTSSFQKPASYSGKGYEDVVGDSQSSQNNTNVDQRCSDDARHIPSEQRSKDSSISESQLGERRKNKNPEVSHSSRSAEASVSGHGDIKESAKFSGSGTSASKIVAERERQGSEVSGKTKSESSFRQSDSRSSESHPAPSTPSRPRLPTSSSIGSLSSSEKPTLNPDAKFEATMNTLPDPQSKSSSNVSPHRKEKSCDSLVAFTSCMIGHHVEVHLNDGSVYSGIFLAADMEKNFGIVLKNAFLIKESTLREHKSRSEFSRKPPFKTLIILADELVQVLAKNLSVSSDGMLNAVQSEKPMELLTDSSISKSRHVNQGRELIPWEPDGNVPPGLDNVFDDTSKRQWNQFEANELLFGVKSTFDEKQYTTTLPRSTQTRELEEKAQKIATESEDEIIRHVHVAEERGLQLSEKSDIDEETKYSAVRRVDKFDDGGFNEEDDKLLDTCNDKNFGGSSTSSVQKSTSSSGKGYKDVPDVPGQTQPSRNNTNVDQSCSISGDDAQNFPSEQRSKDFPAPSSSISESQLGERRKNNSPEVSHSSRSAGESVSGHGDIKEDAELGVGETSTSKIFKQFEAAMDTLPAPQSKSSSNGYPRRREKSRDSLVYLTTCMIGHLVEVHLKNGSVYSGIFHAADVEKDFGIVLKMASLIKDSRQRSRSDFFRKPPFKTFIVPADELVQVVAEDLSVSSDVTLNTVQSEKPVELLTDSSSVQKPAFSSGKGYENIRGDGQPSRNNTNVDQSCSISGDDARQIPSEQRSKDFPAPGSSISERQLDERRKDTNLEVSHSSRSAEESVSGHGDIKEGAKIVGGGTSASKTVTERERQGSQVSGKTKSEISFGQSDSRSLESRPAPSTPSRPELPPSSSIGSLSSSEKFTFDPNAKEFEPSQPPVAVQAQSPTEYTSFYCPAEPVQRMPVQAQSPMAGGSFYYPAAPVQQMPVQAQSPMADGSFYYPAAPFQQMPGGYGIQPQYFEQPMFYDQYYGQQYGQTGYPQYAQAQYSQQQQQPMMMPPRPQMMMGQPPRPPPPHQP